MERHRHPSSLAAAFDPQRNALAMLRLGLAGLVAVTHATQIGFGWQWRIGDTLLGELAVDAFFVLSGFLVTRSLLRLRSTGRYAWHRFLRIVPGFAVCLLLTAFVLAPVVAVMSGRTAGSVFSGPESAPAYVLNNALLLIRQFGVSGLPANPYAPDVMNGVLWTLFYEAACYAALAVVAALGLLHRRGLLLAACGGLWLLTVLAAAGWAPLGSEYMLRFALVFLLGAAGYVFADRVPVSDALAVAAAVTTGAALLLLHDYRALAGPAFAYLCLWAMVRVPLRQNPRVDLSYGLYIYHYPLAQILAVGGVAALGPVGFVAIAIAVGLAAAGASWTLVEGPALALKDAGRAARPPVSPRRAARV